MCVKNMKFWLENPRDLFASLELLPTSCMDNNEKLNALTRLVLVLAVVLYFMDKQQLSLTVLVLGLALILLVYNMFGRKPSEGYTFPRKFNFTAYEPVGVPANRSPNGLPSYSQEIPQDLESWIEDINSGYPQDHVPPMLHQVNKVATTPIGQLVGPELEYIPFSNDDNGEVYRKRIPMGQYLHSQAQQHTSRMNYQMNLLQKEKMFRVQRTNNRHSSNPNGLPNMGLNVNYTDDPEMTQTYTSNGLY